MLQKGDLHPACRVRLTHCLSLLEASTDEALHTPSEALCRGEEREALMAQDAGARGARRSRGQKPKLPAAAFGQTGDEMRRPA